MRPVALVVMLLLGEALLLIGIAFWSLPASFVVAGVQLVAGAILLDDGREDKS